MQERKTEELSSSAVRDEIVSQHRRLRDLLDQAVAVTVRLDDSSAWLPEMRAKAEALYEALATHMDFEEQALPAALRDVIGWGQVIQQRMEEDHFRQREALRLAISAAEAHDLSARELAENVRAFAATLLVDMESEEGGLLQADLDEMASGSSRGG